jgi:hypothetical protein
MDIRGTLVHVVSVPDVLFLPDSRIQIVGSTLVPFEANPNPLALGTMQEAARDLQVRRVYSRSEFEYADAEVCVLSNIFSPSFFHWMEEMYKVAILEQYGFEGCYVSHSLPEYTLRWLELFGVTSDRVIHHVDGPTVFRSAFFTTMLGHVDILSYPGIFYELREKMLGRLERAIRARLTAPGYGWSVGQTPSAARVT